MTLAPQLSRLGDDLERACAADLAARRPRRTRRLVLVAAAVAAIESRLS